MRKDFDSPIIMVKEGETTPCGLYIPYGVVTDTNDVEIYNFLNDVIRKNLKIVYKFVSSITNEGYVCLVNKEEAHVGDLNELNEFLNQTIHRLDLAETDLNTRIDILSRKLNSFKDGKNVGESMYILYDLLPEKLKKELKIYIKK